MTNRLTVSLVLVTIQGTLALVTLGLWLVSDDIRPAMLAAILSAAFGWMAVWVRL